MNAKYYELTHAEMTLLRLTLTRGATHKRLSELISLIGGIKGLESAGNSEVETALGGNGRAEYAALVNSGAAERMCERIRGMGARIITRLNDEYPESLKGIFDPPYLLYAKGSVRIDGHKNVAVVGARKATKYGMSAAHSLSMGLARGGATIVSGLARGIDSAAHKAALDVKGATVAILGNGLDVVYPPEHIVLQEAIAESGVIVSEFPLGASSIGRHFIMRNRIIAGLSAAVILVEGTRESGAMTTVNYALDQGREVFAVPGQITSPLSYSPNRLIKDGMHSVLEPADVFDVMGWEGAIRHDYIPIKRMPPGLSPEEAKVVKLLLEEDMSYEKLCDSTGIRPENLNSLLTMLELRGIIKQHPGKMFSV